MTSSNISLKLSLHHNMQAITTLSNTLLSSLRNWLAKFLISGPEDFSQPLLTRKDILELRHRMFSQNTQPGNTHDTAHKHMGDTRSIHRGYGLDYEESRPYQPGDEPRYMNWPLTARTGELYMKVFREERHPGIFVLLDRRNSMRFGTRTRLKVTQAARLTACIAFAAQQHHASVGGVILEAAPGVPQWIKETVGEQAAFDLIYAASAPCPPVLASQVHSSPSTENEFDFGYVLNMLQAMLIPGTTLYLISDFIDLEQQHRSRLMQLAAQNQVHAIHIFDPAEQHLPRGGRARFQTSSDDPDVTVDTNAASTNKSYNDAALKHFTARKQLFHALNIKYTQVSTECDTIETELTAL